MDDELTTTSKAVLDTWLGAGEQAWYKRDDAFDANLRTRFLTVWEAASEGACDDWVNTREGALALIILLDQLPRNMFRDDPRAFATDTAARAAARVVLEQDRDFATPEPERQFFYMPFMHSENLADQDLCVELFAKRMKTGDNLVHARAHREIIRKFSRFPYRNAVLGRTSTPAEERFLDEGGYGAILRELQAD